jgi:hypothetical protein
MNDTFVAPIWEATNSILVSSMRALRLVIDCVSCGYFTSKRQDVSLCIVIVTIRHVKLPKLMTTRSISETYYFLLRRLPTHHLSWSSVSGKKIAAGQERLEETCRSGEFVVETRLVGAYYVTSASGIVTYVSLADVKHLE